MHIPKAKLPFYPPYEVKYRLQNGVSTGAFNIKYMPHTSIKGQVLADLVAEFAECPEEVEWEIRHWSKGWSAWPLFRAYRLGSYMLMEQLINGDQEWG